MLVTRGRCAAGARRTRQRRNVASALNRTAPGKIRSVAFVACCLIAACKGSEPTLGTNEDPELRPRRDGGPDGGGIRRDGGRGDGGAADGGPADGGVPDGGADAGLAAPPIFYFVVHADPAKGGTLTRDWGRLEALMAKVAAVNAAGSARHHITIMFTGNWAKLLATDASKRKTMAGWIAEGHEMALHSHTHNHANRDGYSNATAVFGADDTASCDGDADAGECTLDYATDKLKQAISAALDGGSYDLRFAAIGPTGNGGDAGTWGLNDNSCNPLRDDAGYPIADDTRCLDEEFVGAIESTFNYTSTDYEGLVPTDAGTLLGRSRCTTLAHVSKLVYTLPHAAYETESSATKVALTTWEAAFAAAGPSDLLGLVIHPASYVDGGSSTFSGNAMAQIDLIFDALAAESARRSSPVVSRTLSEVHAADLDGGGAKCHDLRTD